MNINHFSRIPLPSRALSRGTLPSRSLKRPKPALLKSREVSLLCTLLFALRILHFIISGLLQPRLPLTITLFTSPSSCMRTRSRITLLLIGFSITWRRKLSPTYSRKARARNLGLLTAMCSNAAREGHTCGSHSWEEVSFLQA